MSSELASSQLHRFSFELIGTTFIYAIIVYLITETLPQLKLSFCVSCRIYVISYQFVSTICLYMNKYNNTYSKMTYLQMM